jgi:hypothetical protein
MRLIKWLKTNFETARGLFYLGTGLIFGVTSIILQSNFQPIYVSSVFDIGFEGIPQKIVKSTSGQLESREDVKNCILKIVLPFDSPPPAISPQYLCPWDNDENSGLKDALCYTDFKCEGIQTIHVLSLLSPTLFIFGYILLLGLLFTMRKIQVSRKTFILISLFGTISVISGFGIVKSIPYVTDYLLRDVFQKIRSVTLFKGGVNYLEFETIKYILHRKIIIARTLLDILAGFSIGLILMMVDKYRRITF